MTSLFTILYSLEKTYILCKKYVTPITETKKGTVKLQLMDKNVLKKTTFRNVLSLKVAVALASEHSFGLKQNHKIRKMISVKPFHTAQGSNQS